MKRTLVLIALCSFLGCQSPSDVEPVAADLESKDVAADAVSDGANDRNVAPDDADVGQTAPTSPGRSLAKNSKPSEFDVAAEIDETIKAFQREGADFMVRYRQTPPDQQSDFFEKERPDGANTVRRLAELAQADPENPAVLKAATFVGTLGKAAGDSQEYLAKIFDVVRTHHLQSEQLGELCFRLAPTPGGRELIEQIVAATPRDSVKYVGLYALSQNAADEEKEVAILKQIAAYDGEVIFRGRYDVVQMAKSRLFEVENLQIGKVAPEIEGEDLQGETLKLSDYRGKVVVLDFWGDW